MLINESMGELGDEAKSIDLARVIFDKIIDRQHLGLDHALNFVIEEIQQNF